MLVQLLPFRVLCLVLSMSPAFLPHFFFSPGPLCAVYTQLSSTRDDNSVELNLWHAFPTIQVHAFLHLRLLIWSNRRLSHPGSQAESSPRVQVTVTMRDGRQLTYNPGRRDALQRVLIGAALLGQDSLRWMWQPSSASAGLLQFPTSRLNNSYYLVRSRRTHLHLTPAVVHSGSFLLWCSLAVSRCDAFWQFPTVFHFGSP